MDFGNARQNKKKTGGWLKRRANILSKVAT